MNICVHLSVTHTGGINLTGPFPWRVLSRLSLALNAFVQDTQSSDNTVDRLAHVTVLNLSAPVGGGWTGRFGLFVRGDNDRTANGLQTTTSQVTLGVTRAVALLGWRGSVAPDLLLRHVDRGPGRGWDTGLNLGLFLARWRHLWRLNYNVLAQNRRATGTQDLLTHAAAIQYQYLFLGHALGIEANYQGRDPDGGRDTHAYRLSLFWTYRFDKPPRRTERAARELPAPGRLDLSAFPLNSALATGRARLRDDGFGAGVEQPGMVVYDLQVLEEIDQRQRLVFVHDGVRLRQTVLVIDFDDVGNLDSTVQTFERVRAALIRRYGRPSSTLARGDFTARLDADVNAERFLRLSEWVREEGILRFGIPRRLDEQVRMEVHFARSFPPPMQTLWSLEELP